MGNPYRCPVCNTLMEEDKDAGFKIPPQCPYRNALYPELCSLHDKLYFGKWRKMEAHPADIERAYAKLGQLLSRVQAVIREENIPQARQDVLSAADYEMNYDVVLPFKEDL